MSGKSSLMQEGYTIAFLQLADLLGGEIKQKAQVLIEYVMISGGIFHYWALKGFNYLSVSMSNNQTQSDLHILTALIFGLSFCLFLSSSSILTISGSAMSIGVEPQSKYIAVSTISFAGIKVAITLHIKNINRRQLGCWPVNS